MLGSYVAIATCRHSRVCAFAIAMSGLMRPWAGVQQQYVAWACLEAVATHRREFFPPHPEFEVVLGNKGGSCDSSTGGFVTNACGDRLSRIRYFICIFYTVVEKMAT